MNRAYSVLTIKSVSDDQRVITGTATTPTPDRVDDIVEPLGVSFKNPLPLLLYHDSRRPVGLVKFDKPTKDGITFTATLPKITEPGTLKDRVDEAWLSVKERLLRGVSIGFRSLEQAFLKTGGVRFLKTEVMELSLVAVPANADATISMIKSLDQASAASGASSVSSIPGVSGSARKTPMKNASEQLTAAKADLQIKSTRLEELMNDDETNGGLDETESTERDTLMTAIKSVTAKVDQLQTLEAAQAKNAIGLTLAPATRTTPRVEFKAVELPKATLFTRVAMSLMAGRGSMSDSMEYAKQFTNTPEVLAYIKHGFHRKAAEPGQAIFASPGWGSELVNPNTVATEFVELLRPQTIIGRVNGFRNVPFNIPIITQTGGSTFQWVGEASPKPVGELAFDRTTLTFSKAAGIVVMDEELVKLARPDAEATVRQDMIEQCAKFLDEQFIQVSVSAGASNPASITNGVASPTATGTTAAALRHDLNIALTTFTAAGVSTRGIVIVMTSALARGISLLTTSLGVPEFQSMTPEGGTLIGYTVIVSDSVDAGTVVLFQPGEVFLADDGRVTLDASREATLDMSGSTTATFSLWQNNCVGLRAERWIRWQKRRATGTVAVIDTAAYAPA